MKDGGAAIAVAATVAGTLAGERLGPGGGTATLFAAAAVAAAALVARRHRRGGALCLAALALVLIAATSMQRALDGLDGRLAALARDDTEVTVTARLTDDPRSTLGSTRVPAHLGPSVVMLVAHGPTAMRLRLLTAGESAIVDGRLRPLRSAEGRLRWRHVAAVLEAGDLRGVAPARSPVLRLANRLRRLVLGATSRLPGDQRGLVAGLLVGDDRGLSPPLLRDFRAAGLSHLLAVSGANVALTLTVVAPLLRRLGLAGRFVGGLAVLFVFAAMTRFEPSVLRACAMASITLLAHFAGRPASGLRVLCLAVGALLLADPFLVHSAGFQLSCAASAGIILLAPALAARAPGPPWLREPLSVTAAAQLAVAPVALPTFGRVPLVALPANLLVAPAAAALTLYGLGVVLPVALAEACCPGLSLPAQQPMGALAAGISAVARAAGRLPCAVDARTVCAAVAAGATTAAAILIVRRSSRSSPGPVRNPGADPARTGRAP